MTDPIVDPVIDLDPATIIRACRGNVANLPSFLVHDDHVWPNPRRIRVDNRARIHCRRSTFFRVICPRIPVRPGLWLREDMQQFFIALEPHHLQGSEGMRPLESHAHLRPLLRPDHRGNLPEDPDYEPVRKSARISPEEIRSLLSRPGIERRSVVLRDDPGPRD